MIQGLKRGERGRELWEVNVEAYFSDLFDLFLVMHLTTSIRRKAVIHIDKRFEEMTQPDIQKK